MRGTPLAPLPVALVAAGCGAGRAEPAEPAEPVAVVVASPRQAAPPPEEIPSLPPAPEAARKKPSLAPVGVGTPEPLRLPKSTQRSTQPTRPLALAPLKARWSTAVGKTTFRTTMVADGGLVWVGTHGATLDGKGEPSDGVYALEAKTGKVRRQLRPPGGGDKDVGGIALDGDRVVFTTDSGLVVSADLAGSVAWRATLGGKVRPAPALADLDGKGRVDVVVGDEQGVLWALDGDSGAPLWRHATGQNDYGARGFVGAAAVADVDGDGRDDVVAGARDGVLAAYRGRDGTVLWQVKDGSGMHASPTIVDPDGSGRREVLAAWSYSSLALFDLGSGALEWGQELTRDDVGIEGLFGTPTLLPGGASGVVVAPTSWWRDKDGVILVGPAQRAFRAYEGRVTSSAVVTDLDGDGTLEAILGTEAGKLLALRADGGRAELARLKGGIEATPMLADADGDGTQELFVASNDGKLTCFATGSRAKPKLSRFRGESPHNRGEHLEARFSFPPAAPAAPLPFAPRD